NCVSYARSERKASASRMARLRIGRIVVAVSVWSSVRIDYGCIYAVVVECHELQAHRLNVQSVGGVSFRICGEGIAAARRAAISHGIDGDARLPLKHLFGNVGRTFRPVIAATEPQ